MDRIGKRTIIDTTEEKRPTSRVIPNLARTHSETRAMVGRATSRTKLELVILDEINDIQ